MPLIIYFLTGDTSSFLHSVFLNVKLTRLECIVEEKPYFSSYKKIFSFFIFFTQMWLKKCDKVFESYLCYDVEFIAQKKSHMIFVLQSTNISKIQYALSFRSKNSKASMQWNPNERVTRNHLSSKKPKGEEKTDHLKALPFKQQWWLDMQLNCSI